MSLNNTYNDAAQDAQSQISALRQQVNQLMSDRVSPMLNDAASKAQYATQQASDYTKYATQQATDYTKEQASAVAEQVRGRPLVAIAIAGAVGYVLGRFIR